MVTEQITCICPRFVRTECDVVVRSPRASEVVAEPSIIINIVISLRAAFLKKLGVVRYWTYVSGLEISCATG